ncbi:hypothetical protein [Cognatiyoonia sp. IB215182]|uniref:hypothetical protein n=1 Tax=Cognatiyoonia sp. IB215182 TaxID=3097353 RepID=UPI002A176A0A|nr:hypothetical protein [Cognatiyoonia sp. IB215182]MDX8354321.1 hypothetical protein [Cognatiyoonia sp. IB215182]
MKKLQILISLVSLSILPVAAIGDELISEARGSFWVNLSDYTETRAQEFQFGKTYLSGCSFDQTQFLVTESKSWWRPKVYFTLAIDEDNIVLRDLFVSQGSVGLEKDLSPEMNNSSGILRRDDLGDDRQSMYVAVKADIAGDDAQFKSVEIWLDGTFSRLSVDEDFTTRPCSEGR